jgi:hypothetical protein
MSSKNSFKPGQEADTDLTLLVKNASGKTLSEISVPAGHRIPPTRIKGATSYSKKK